MKNEIKTKTVGFRVSEEEWNLLESSAIATGEGIHDWCRNLVLEIAGKERGMTRNERVIFEELSRVRYLIGNGFKLMTGGDEELAEKWEDARENANLKAAEIAEQLLSKSRSFNANT